MASMNWLGFTLSPQELPSQQAQQDMSNSDVSPDECFDLGSASTAPTFGILEAFQRDNQSQDWNLKDAMGMNSMLLGTNNASTCNQEPKLENFLDNNHSLGGASSYDHHNNHNQTNGGDYSFSNCGLQLPFNPASNLTNPSSNNNNNINNHGINVSMIKTWLRNQPSTNKDEVVGVEGGTLNNKPQSTLSLSMMSGGPDIAPPLPLLAAGGDSKDSLPENDSISKLQDDCNGGDVQSGAIVEAVPRKSIDTFGQRTSIYRGVTRHRWTGRYEAHLWDNSCRREGQTRKGRQGGYDKEEKAARSYDLAAIKYWGTTTTTNFPISNYEKEVEEMKHMTRQEYTPSAWKMAGQNWKGTQEEAAEAYDIAAIKFRGLNAVTNFEINRYDVKAILESSALPIGGAGKRMKDVEELTGSDRNRSAVEKNIGAHFPGYHTGGWPAIAFQQQQQQPQALSMQQYHQYSQQQRLAAGAAAAAWCKQEQVSAGSTSSINGGYNQDIHNHHLQLGAGGGNNNTHDFFHHHQQTPYNLMGIDESPMEQISESNSVMYGGGDSVNGGGYLMQMASVESGESGNGNLFGSGNVYYHHQQGNESWIPTAVAAAPRSGNMVAPPTFTVWNDT
ncbi:hypothetical protein V2J09_019808 [Rumex salicifolius]